MGVSPVSQMGVPPIGQMGVPPSAGWGHAPCQLDGGTPPPIGWIGYPPLRNVDRQTPVKSVPSLVLSTRAVKIKNPPTPIGSSWQPFWGSVRKAPRFICSYSGCEVTLRRWMSVLSVGKWRWIFMGAWLSTHREIVDLPLRVLLKRLPCSSVMIFSDRE